METIIAKVIKQGEAYTVASQKAEGGQIAKCQITLQLFGGKYGDSFVCTMLGNLAACRFAPGSLVVAKLRFWAHEYDGNIYQDVVVEDIEAIRN